MAKSLSQLITGSRGDSSDQRRKKRRRVSTLNNPNFWAQPRRGMSTYGKYKS